MGYPIAETKNGLEGISVQITPTGLYFWYWNRDKGHGKKIPFQSSSLWLLKDRERLEEVFRAMERELVNRELGDKA